MPAEDDEKREADDEGNQGTTYDENFEQTFSESLAENYGTSETDVTLPPSQSSSAFRAHNSSGDESTEISDSLEAPTLRPNQARTADSTTPLPPNRPFVVGVPNASDDHSGQTPNGSSQNRYFAEYELLSEIARGGMGVVFKARQVNLNRVVALKMILSGQLASAEDVLRFKTEAEAAANLDHPGIVPIFEIGEHLGQHYFSMGYVEGKSLADLVHSGPLVADKASELTRRICEAMGYAHQQHVIHRDLKPANILIDQAGLPKVTDFGLAKRTSADSNLTGTGQILGTPSYMAPEQASGKVDEVGPLADVYSIGAILYCLLTGRPPFQAANPMDTLLQVLDKDPVRPRELNPSVPADLETICLKCLNKDPNKRYDSAVALGAELERFERGEPIFARPVTRVERGWRWARRHPLLSVLSAAVILLTATLAVGGPLAAISQTRLRNKAIGNERRANELAAMEIESRRAAEAGEQDLAIEKDKSDRSLYARSVALAYEQFRSANLTGAEDTLASLDASKRGFEWSYVDGLCRSELQTHSGLSDIARDLAFSPDGQHIVATDRGDNSKFYVWETGAVRPSTVRDLSVIAISQYGEQIALADPDRPNRIKVMEPVEGRVISDFPTEIQPDNFSTFGGPGNTLIAAAFSDQTVRAWDVRTGAEITRIETPDHQTRSPIALSHSGEFIGWRRKDDGAVEIRELLTGKVRFEGPAVKKMANRGAPVAFAPHDQAIAVGRYGAVEVFSVPDGRLVAELAGLRGYVYSIDYSPAGDRIAATCEDGSIRVYDAESGKLISRLSGHETGAFFGITAVKFDKSGDRLLSGGTDLQLKVWDAWSGDKSSLVKDGRLIKDGPEPSQLVDYIDTDAEVIEGLMLSANDKYLLASSDDQVVRMFDTETGELVKQLQLDKHYCTLDLDSERGLFAVGSGGLKVKSPGSVKVFDSSSGELRWEYGGSTTPIKKVKYFDGGKRLAVCTGSLSASVGSLFVLDGLTGELIWKSESVAMSVSDMAITPDGREIATVGATIGIQWTDAQTGKLLRNTGGRAFFSVAISRDGRQVVAGGTDWSVRLFRREGNDEIWSTTRHGGVVTAVAFAADDRRIVSVAIDGTTRVWDTTYGDLILTMEDDGEEKLALAVTESGNLIASSGQNSVIVLRRIRDTDKMPESSPEDWRTLLVDRFDRPELGEDWTVGNGEWKMGSGRVQGELTPSPSTPSLYDASITLNRVLPAATEVSFELRVDSPMIIQNQWKDDSEKNLISVLYIGISGLQWNRGEPGAAVITLAPDESVKEVASRRGGFDLQPDKNYKIRTRRTENRVQCYIDDRLYRETEVTAAAPIPILSLTGLSLTPNAKFWLSNLKVKVPVGSEAEVQATKMLTDLLRKDRLLPVVTQRIARMDDASILADAPTGVTADAVRQAATELSQTWRQSRAEVMTEASMLAAEGDREPAEYDAIQRWFEQSVQFPTIETNRVLATIAFRANDFETAWKAVKQSSAADARQHGSKHPIDVAIAILLLEREGKPEVAATGRKQLEQLVLAKHWQQDETIGKWLSNVRSVVPMPAPNGLEQWLCDQTWLAENELRLRGDISHLDRLLDDDAKFVQRRSVGEGALETRDAPHRLVVSKNGWLAAEKLWHRGSRLGVKLVRERVSVKLSNELAIVESRFVQELPGGFLAWVQADSFAHRGTAEPGTERTDEWKITKRDCRLDRVRFEGKQFDFGRDGWLNIDNDVDQQSDPIAKISLLRMASRHQEAFDLSQSLARDSDNPSHHLELLKSAYGVRDAKTMRSAIQQAIDLDSMAGAVPAARALAAELLAETDATDLGKEIKGRPPTFYQSASNELLYARDQGMATWSPTNDSLVGLTSFPKQAPIGDLVESQISARVNSFGAKVIEQGELTVSGLPARQFVISGLGIGRAMASQGKPTLQRFVWIERGNDYVMALVSAYEDEFIARDSEFSTFLESLIF